MDIYTVFDLSAIAISLGVLWKIRSIESLILTVFFSVTAISSEAIFYISNAYNLDLTGSYSGVFIGAAVLFGLMSRCHPIVLGYIAYLFIIGMNAISELPFYSGYIYSIYAFQLFVVSNGRNYNSHHNRSGFFGPSHS